jgi:hypothetical protein
LKKNTVKAIAAVSPSVNNPAQNACDLFSINRFLVFSA